MLAIVKISDNDRHFINMHCMEKLLTPPPQSLVSGFLSIYGNGIFASAIMKKSKNAAISYRKISNYRPPPQKNWVCCLPLESPMCSITLPDIFFGDNRIKRMSKPIIVKITKTCSKCNNKEIHNICKENAFNFRKQSSLHWNGCLSGIFSILVLSTEVCRTTWRKT